MGLSEFYGPPMEQRAAINLLHEAIDLGVEHFDTAELYGIGAANESLLGEAFADRRDRVFIATKFGPTRDYQTGEFMGLDGSPENCRRAIESSLLRLRTDHVDLYYLQRVTRSVVQPRFTRSRPCNRSIRSSAGISRLMSFLPALRSAHRWWPTRRSAEACFQAD
jgi:aryl-alcohol dehydrogenase-like predicted oxidoreductase